MNIIIFGVGKLGAKLLQMKSYNTIAFSDNDYLKERRSFCGLPVIFPSKIPSLDYDAVIMALPLVNDSDEQIIYEAAEQLRMIGVPEEKLFIYFDNEENASIKSIKSLDMQLRGVKKLEDYAVLYKRLNPKSIVITHTPYVKERCSKRKLYLYGTGYAAICLTKYLLYLGIEVEKYIDDDCKVTTIDGKEIISSIDLVYEDVGHLFIIVVNEKESYGTTREKLAGVGLIEDYDFTYYSEIPGTNEPFCHDVTLSYSRIRDTNEGFEIFGNPHDSNAIKIFALGGSTTESSLFYVKGWVQFLADRLQVDNIPAVVYGGGISGYTSTQELLKLERDVIPLKPDVVISYSGINDLYMYPFAQNEVRYKKPFITKFQTQFINQILEKLSKLQYGLPTPDIPNWEAGGNSTVFYGLQNNKSAPRFWIDNMRMMYALSQEFGIAFFSFFQPYRFNGYYQTTLVQDIIHSRRDPSCTPSKEGEILYCRNKELEEIQNLIENYDYIVDLSKIFAEESSVYYDSVHVYEKGNQIIANKIYEVLIKHLQTMQ